MRLHLLGDHYWMNKVKQGSLNDKTGQLVRVCDWYQHARLDADCPERLNARSYPLLAASAFLSIHWLGGFVRLGVDEKTPAVGMRQSLRYL